MLKRRTSARLLGKDTIDTSGDEEDKDEEEEGGEKMVGSSLRRIAFAVLAFVPIRGDFIKETAVTEDIVEQVPCAGWVARRAYTTKPRRFHSH